MTDLTAASHKLNVAVIFGGRSGEHEVSLMSARSVLAVLSPEKYNIVQIGITHAGQWVTGEGLIDALAAEQTSSLTPVVLMPEPGRPMLYTLHAQGDDWSMRPLCKVDVVFPVLHGSFGEDGTMQGLLEMADVAYVGAGVLGSSVGMDKGLFKDVMITHDIPVLESIIVTRDEIRDHMEIVLNRAEQVSAYPIFTKPANLGSSVGVSKCRSRADMLEGLMEAASFDRRVLVERGLKNPREIEVSVLGNENPIVSVPGEIVPSDDFYTYKAKYLDGLSELCIPAVLPTDVIESVRRCALEAYQAVDCAGMARVDFLVDRETLEVYLNEINTIPGFTSISMYPKLWEASGIPYSELVDRLIALALDRKADRDRTERQYGRNA